MFDFDGDKDDSSFLAFRRGDIIEVYEKNDSIGLYHGRNRNTKKRGKFRAAYTLPKKK